MVKEKIFIKAHRESCEVFCNFWFYNYGKSNFLTVGFPDYVENIAVESKPIRNFTAYVNGNQQEIMTAKQIITEKHGENSYKYWYVWYTNFPSRDTVYIENTYSGDWGGSICTRFFHYDIGTGRTWYKDIGAGEIIIDYSDVASDNFLIKDRYSNLTDEITIIEREDSLVFTFNDLIPQQYQVISIEFLSYWNFRIPDYEFIKKEYQKLIADKKTARLMRNEIFARHGYLFTDPELKAYFGKKKWYKPNQKFTFDDLNTSEKQAVTIIKEIEDTIK